ncbi:MAG TPA: cytochrome c oxidase subunit II [Candidatus Limnocylindrales bacterium]
MTLPRVRLPRLATGLGLLLATVALAGCQAIQGMYPPPAATDQGRQIRDLYDIVFAIAVVIFLIVEGLIVFAVVRYRRRPGDTELPPQIHGNNAIEIIWTVVPTIIVAFLFYVSWQTLNTVEARSADPALRIRAVASRFQWEFDYLSPDGSQVVYKQVVPDMMVPVGQIVSLSLRSPDVIHAFYVPQFLFKRDVVPGRENAFDFRVDQAGTYRGQCAELCGAFHGAMQFTVTAVAPADFEAWLKKQIEAAPPSPPPSPPPSGGPGPSGSPPEPTPVPTEPAGPVVEISAVDIAFEQASVSAPAGTPFAIRFSNKDTGVPHNVEIKDASGTSRFRGEIFNGVATRDYAVPALDAGSYTFNCSVHTNMTGTLTVQ